MKSWLKNNVRVFRQGYKDGREIARKMHRLGAKPVFMRVESFENRLKGWC